MIPVASMGRRRPRSERSGRRSLPQTPPRRPHPLQGAAILRMGLSVGIGRIQRIHGGLRGDLSATPYQSWAKGGRRSCDCNWSRLHQGSSTFGCPRRLGLLPVSGCRSFRGLTGVAMRRRAPKGSRRSSPQLSRRSTSRLRLAPASSEHPRSSVRARGGPSTASGARSHLHIQQG